MGETAATAPKIGIIGAGRVGVTLAYACLIRGTGKTIALYGRRADRVHAEVMDLQHGLQFVPMATVIGGDDVEVCRDADVLVLTAGPLPGPTATRLDLAAESVAICRDLLPGVLAVAPDAVVLVVTNPVDVITHAVLKMFDLPRNRVIGSGTVLDTSRFRSMIAEHCGVAVQSVHAYIVGEHGDSEVPMWTSATVGGVPVLSWDDPHLPPMTAAERGDVVQQVVGSGYEILRGKGYTNHAVALASARIIEAVIHDEHQVLSVSSLLTDYAGISDVCLSVPTVVNRTGALRVLPMTMSDEERDALHRSASAVRAVIATLDLSAA